MIEGVLVWNVSQLVVFIILIKYMQIQVRDNKQGLDKVMQESYTKTETVEIIDLKLRPIEIGIEHVQNDLKDVKDMLNRLLDEKTK